jgi:hypothetical protein
MYRSSDKALVPGKIESESRPKKRKEKRTGLERRTKKPRRAKRKGLAALISAREGGETISHVHPPESEL